MRTLVRSVVTLVSHINVSACLIYVPARVSNIPRLKFYINCNLVKIKEIMSCDLLFPSWNKIANPLLSITLLKSNIQIWPISWPPPKCSEWWRTKFLLSYPPFGRSCGVMVWLWHDGLGFSCSLPYLPREKISSGLWQSCLVLVVATSHFCFMSFGSYRF